MNRLCILFVAAAVSSIAANRPAINQLVLNRASGTMCWLQKPVKTKISPEDLAKVMNGTFLIGNVAVCGPTELQWDRASDFFRAGDVVEVVIPHPRFLSTFTPTVNATTITENQPQIRGLAGVAPAPPAAANAVSKGLYLSADVALTELKKDFPAAQHAAALLGGLFGQVKDAEEDTRKALAAARRGPYSDLSGFISFVDQTDSILVHMNDLSSLIPTLVADSNKYLQTVDDVNKSINTPTMTTTGELDDYRNGDKFKEIEVLAGGSDLLNRRVQWLFDNVNSLWLISQTLREEHVILGQWSSNSRIDFQVTENPHFQMYSFQGASGNGTPQLTVQQQQIAQQQPAVQNGATPVKLPGTPPSPNPPAGQQPAPVGKQQPPTGSPTLSSATVASAFYFGGHFDVHSFYFANLVSGFIGSTLRNRQYGVATVPAVAANGTPIVNTNGSPVYDDVPTIGPMPRGQLHYYVGVDFYFGEQDFFPHAKKPITPALMFGYGVDAPFNFFLGPNLETRWGLNFGVGYHVGSEQFLSPGTVAGVTQLSSPTTPPPTVSRIRGGGYVNVGFDLSVFKAIFGSLVGLK